MASDPLPRAHWPWIPRSFTELYFIQRLGDPSGRWPAIIADDPCSYCNELRSSQEEQTLDHIIPRSAGGTRHWSNAAPSCRRCQRDKGSGPLWLLFWARMALRMRKTPFTVRAWTNPVGMGPLGATMGERLRSRSVSRAALLTNSPGSKGVTVESIPHTRRPSST